MKVNKEMGLFRVLTGSHLYGTNGANSDYDYKVVCLPPFELLLLNTKLTNRKEKPVGSRPGDKMLANEVETEYLPLQVFMDDFFNGQTYALEVVFAVVAGKFEVLDDNEQWVSHSETVMNSLQFNETYERLKLAQRLCRELATRFLTKNVKKMVGYAVAQSKLYGLKTERFAALKKVVEAVYAHFGEDSEKLLRKVKLQDTPELVKHLTTLEYVKMGSVMNAKGGTEEAPALVVVNKSHVLTSHWDTVLDSLNKELEKYGHRVEQFEGEGVDWKALSHAVRITQQVLELSTTGKLTFPHPNAALLKSMKNGEMQLDEATDYLATEFSKVDDAVNNSVLPEKTSDLEEKFKQWKLDTLYKMYATY